jgi:hypothetical protein
VRQVVFTDVLNAGRLDVDGQSFAPIGLHEMGVILAFTGKRKSKVPPKNSKTSHGPY